MEKQKFEIGDMVHHKANRSINMVIIDVSLSTVNSKDNIHCRYYDNEDGFVIGYFNENELEKV